MTTLRQRALRRMLARSTVVYQTLVSVPAHARRYHRLAHHHSTGGEWFGQRGLDDELRSGLCPGERDDLGKSTCLRGALRESSVPVQHHAATDSTGATFPAACFSVIMFFAPLIRAVFEIPDHTENAARNLLDYRVGTEQAPTNTIVQ